MEGGGEGERERDGGREGEGLGEQDWSDLRHVVLSLMCEGRRKNRRWEGSLSKWISKANEEYRGAPVETQCNVLFH